MRKLAALAIIAIVGGGFYLVRDPGHVPIFDAGLNRLAESEREGWCAGETYWSNRGQPNATAAAECRANSTLDPTPNLNMVQPAFCMAVREGGFPGTVDECQGILDGQKLWPTYDGGLTQSWSKSAPYPGDLAFVVPPDDSRTGDRQGFTRGDTPTTSETTTTTQGEG